MAETHSYVPEPRRARVEIIPLIDVIFFLLATFVLFTLSMNKILSLPATLPAGQVDMGLTEDRTVYLQTSEPGACYWRIGREGTPEFITREEIRPRLEDYKRQLKELPRVVIRGDRTARLGAAVAVLDEVRKAGIGQIAVETVVSKTGG
jgi:biopolymer transport protein ExbD